jgi:hydrogenase expression/formation protein HypC
MCIAYPMKIEHIKGTYADVSIGDIKSTVSIQLIDSVKKGDYVLVHAGIAIEKINQAKAEEILTLLVELGQKIDRGI